MGSLGLEQRTPLQALEAIAKEDPQRLYCIHPKSSDISEGWNNIRFQDLSVAINRTAHWIQENVAPATEPQTLAYMGTNDIRYVAFVFASMKLQHTVRIKMLLLLVLRSNTRVAIGVAALAQKLGRSLASCSGRH